MVKENLVDIFIEKLVKKNKLQKKYIRELELIGGVEKEELNNIIIFFTQYYNSRKYSIDYIVDAYLFVNNMVLEETYYFMLNDRYRYSTFEEVADIVYNDKEYMEKYMIGLSVSDYIWDNHMKMIKYFGKNIKQFEGDKYLEIGPGFGQYLIKAVESGVFKEYYACDVSETSVKGSNLYLKYMGFENRCLVECKDFFEYDSNMKFDCIVMGEVLEHVEKPLMMLKKIFELLSEKGIAFITVPVNAPAIDHITLFRDVDEVFELVKSAGFKIYDYSCSIAGDMELSKAIKKKRAVTVAMILKK